MKKIFKNKLLSTYFILGFALSFVLFCYIEMTDIIKYREWENLQELSGVESFSIQFKLDNNEEDIYTYQQNLISELHGYDVAVNINFYPRLYP